MAPNLAGGRIRSEALDRFLSQHDSHESLELSRDEKLENLDMLTDDIEEQQPSNAGESQPQRDLQENMGTTNTKQAAVNDEVADITGNAGFEMIETTVPVLAENIRNVETPVRAFVLGKSFSNSDEPGNLPGSSMELINKDLKHRSLITEINPEEALIKHDSSIGRVLQVQQGELLEKALKETVSITKEEEQWAVVEKQMAEDLSFAKSGERMLQSSDSSDNSENLPLRENIRNSEQLTLSDTQKFSQLFFPTSSGAPPTVPLPTVRETTYKPILSKRTTVGSGLTVPANSRFSIEIDSPTSYFNTESDSSLRISDSPHTSTSRRRPVVPTSTPQTVSPSNSQIPVQQPNIQSTSVGSKGSINNLETRTTDISGQSSTTLSSTSTRKSLASTTTTQRPSSTNSHDSIYHSTSPTPTGILQIPGHAPEAPADLNLVHHDLSLPFLRGQGARELNPQSGMTAEGATAVILSCVCLLFIALIGLAFFIQKLRKQRLMAKLAANIENPKETHFTTDDGLTTYKLQPAPLALLKSTPVMSKLQQPPHFGTPYPSSNQTTIMTTKPYFSVSNNYPQMNAPLTSKPPRQQSNDDNDSSSENAIMAAKIRAKSKMAASCSNEQNKMAPKTSSCSLPSYDEVQTVKKEVCITSSSGGSAPGGGSVNRRGKLWFALSYDAVQEALLLHVQQARYSQARSAGRVWVEACVLTNRNEVHTVALTDVTTATQSPVFNSRIAFQVALAHLDQLLLRLTLYLSNGGSEDTALGSVIVPLHSTDLSEKNTLIRDLN